MNTECRLTRRAADVDDPEALYESLIAEGIDTLAGYIALTTDFSSDEIMEIVVSSMLGVDQLRRLLALLDVTCYDTSEPAEAAQAVRAVAAHKHMTPDEAAEYVDLNFPAECLAFDKPHASGLEYMDVLDDWWEQIQAMGPFTMSTALKVMRIVFDDTSTVGQWSRNTFVEQLLTKVDEKSDAVVD